MFKDKLEQNLKYIAKLSDKLVLTGGAYLGLRRDGEFIKDDNDLDFSKVTIVSEEV